MTDRAPLAEHGSAVRPPGSLDELPGEQRHPEAEAGVQIARELPPLRHFPHLSGLSAQRLVELLGLRLAPAVAAAGIAWTRAGSLIEPALILICVFAAASLVRRSRYPMHLMPVASALLHLLAPLAGVTLAALIMAGDGNPATQMMASELVAPVVGAWLMTGVGAWVVHRFRTDREVAVAVIGSHEFARGLELELETVGVRGYRVVGCIDPDGSCPVPDVAGVRCLGSLALLRGTVLSHGIELLVLGPLVPSTQTAEGRSGFQGTGVSRLDVFERVADACLDLPVSMIESGQLYEGLFGHVPLGTTNAAWFQYLLHPEFRAGWPASKRLLDLVLASLAALIAIPVLAVSALAIKIQDRGPILHRQRRIGERGEDIQVVKLRTMTPDADGSLPRLTPDEARRVTPVGRVLRRLHIDELPQLWLVLRGKMSLVGPRPELPEIVMELESWFDYYDRRHLVKPGITGWAQVRCGYEGSHIGTLWKLCHDLYYLKRRSTPFDLLIMAETLARVVVPEPHKRPDERIIPTSRAEDLARPASRPV